MNGATDSWSYNGFGEPVGYSAEYNGTPIYSYVLERDSLGRVVRNTETLQGVTKVLQYSYDLAGRLEEVLEDGALMVRYTYDANGTTTRDERGATLLVRRGNTGRGYRFGALRRP